MKFQSGDHYRCCYECGKAFFIPDFETYAFQRKAKYFCKWSCMRKYDAEIEKRKKPKEKPEYYEEPKKCSDCVYNIQSDYGYRTCRIGIARYLYSDKPACRRFAKTEKEKNDG